MGQYFNPAILGKNKKTVVKWMYSHDYSNGLKLMEHSWLTNNFVNTFESLIFKNPQPVVWAGDYGEECKGRKSNIYTRCLDKLKVIIKTDLTDKDTRFVINHTKKIFVDKKKVPKSTAKWIGKSIYKIHPLPLLTAEGNGNGGGDYFGNDTNELVGSWARDTISVDNLKPNKDYSELVFDLKEE